MVHVIRGNSKIGLTANVSLPPIVCCVNSDACAKDCYAVKFYNMWPEVKTAWDDNLREVLSDPGLYFDQIRRYLLRYKPQYFRWHVSGDILDQSYFEKMKEIAKDYVFVSFVVFTKNYALSFDDIPVNLSVVISVWEDLPVPDLRLPQAFVYGHKRNGAKNYIDCPGHCEGCRVCWNLKELNRNVMLEKH